MPLLLTPGPLTTSVATRNALLDDHGSRDPAFTALVTRVRTGLAELVGPDFTCVPMQGSGTFSVEAMIGTFVPPDGGLLVCVNGAYGRRIAALAERMGRRVATLVHDETEPIDPGRLDAALLDMPWAAHVAVIHCETTTGLLNPVQAIADVVALRGRRLLVDSMSAFGALPLPRSDVLDAVAASSNKCLEGVPGIGFVLCRESVLPATRGNAHSVSLDLHDQWARLAKDGQFRFTPPTHVLAALDAALEQHTAEGGTEGRGARYRANCETLVSGLRERGFATLLPDDQQAPIIVTVHEPDHPAWNFQTVYDGLLARGFAIYPGKLTAAPTFRVGCIGHVFPTDIERFLDALDAVLDELGVHL